MKKQATKRIAAALLALALVVGLLPSFGLTQAEAASAGDIVVTSNGTMDTSEAAYLPITIHNYANDGMLFEYASYTGGDNTYARLTAAEPSSYYGESWFLTTQPTTGTTYHISPVTNRKINLAVADNGTGQGTNVLVWDATTGNGGSWPYNEWVLVDAGGGYFYIQNAISGLRVNRAGSGNTAGTNVHLWPGDLDDNKWKFEQNGDGSFTIVSATDSNAVLDVDSTAPSAEANVQVGTRGNSNISGWTLTALDLPSTRKTFTGTTAQTAVSGTQKVENAQYMALVYNVNTTETSALEQAGKFRLVASTGSQYALNFDGTNVTMGTDANVYLRAERDGQAFILNVYNGSDSASVGYVGVATGNNIRGGSLCLTARANAVLFTPVQHSDGSWSFVNYEIDETDSARLCLDMQGGVGANNLELYSWNDTAGQRFTLVGYESGSTITWDNKDVTLGVSYESATGAAGSASQTVALSTAPGYHTIVVDMSKFSGYSAAAFLEGVSLTAGSDCTVSLAGLTCFATKAEAEAYNTQAMAYMVDVAGSPLSTFDGQTVESSLEETTSSGLDQRTYHMGNNLAYGMLLPNSGYTGGSYSHVEFSDGNYNFGYAPWFTSTQDNTTWKAYAVYNSTYTAYYNGRWFVNQGSSGDDALADWQIVGPYNWDIGGAEQYENVYWPAVTIDGNSYMPANAYLQQLHSYIDGMATIGLTELELDPETKQPIYTQETVEKLATLLNVSLAITEQDASGFWNYNFVQGEANAALYGTTSSGEERDMAQWLRERFASTSSGGSSNTSVSDWDSYVATYGVNLAGHSWSEVASTDPTASGQKINNPLDAAYWMLNNLYQSNGVSQDVTEYNHLLLTKETDNDNNTYYCFDGGYSNVTYDIKSGGIYNNSSSTEKDLVYYNDNYTTTLNPFLPTQGSSTFKATNSPYFADDGVSVTTEDDYSTYVQRDYNYTMEGHGEFIYDTSQNLYFTFEGDDDVYLFINNTLVMDIGAAHSITKSTFNLNDYADALDLEDGETYDFDFFYTERHGYGANIRIETNISVTSPDVQTTKGAKEDGSTLDNYAMVETGDELDYYFTIENVSLDTRLTSLSFSDDTLNFYAGYDRVDLGSDGGTGTARSISDIYLELKNADGKVTKIIPTTETDLQNFLLSVDRTDIDGAPAGLGIGESLTLYGVHQTMTSEQFASASGGVGAYQNTVITTANGIYGFGQFTVYNGQAQTYYQWADHPVEVLASDIVGGSEELSNIYLCSGDGTIYAARALPNGLYSIGNTKVGRQYVWSASGQNSENANELCSVVYHGMSDQTQAWFYVQYEGSGYYSIRTYNESGTNVGYVGIAEAAGNDTRITFSSTLGDYQLWRITLQDNGTYTIMPKDSVVKGLNYAVDLDSAGQADGTKIHLYSLNENDYWAFNSLDGGHMTSAQLTTIVFNYDTPGVTTRFFKTSTNDSAAIYAVNVYTCDVEDDTVVLDYGLASNLTEDGVGVLANDSLEGSGTDTVILEGLVTGASYDRTANAISATGTGSVSGTYGDYASDYVAAADTGTFTYNASTAYMLCITDSSGNEFAVTYENTSTSDFCLRAKDESNQNQWFYFRPTGDANNPTYAIELYNGAKMNIKGGTSAIENGAVIINYGTRGETPDENEQWKIRTSSAGMSIRAAYNVNYCLEVSSGNIANGTTIQLYEYNGTAAQVFSLTPVETRPTGASQVKFTPSQIINGASTAQMALRVKETGAVSTYKLGQVDIHTEVEMYENLTVIPASVVYYEDDFPGLTYYDNDGNTVSANTTSANITVDGTSANTLQSASQSQNYGQDAAYSVSGSLTTSGGVLHKILITGTGRAAEFSFNGTGFEIISRANNTDAANFIVKVYNSDGNTVKLIPVITEYSNDGVDGTTSLYQVPAVRVDDLAWGTYKVELYGIPKYTYVTTSDGDTILTETGQYFIFNSDGTIQSTQGGYLCTKDGAAVGSNVELEVNTSGTPLKFTRVKNADGSYLIYTTNSSGAKFGLDIYGGTSKAAEGCKVKLYSYAASDKAQMFTLTELKSGGKTVYRLNGTSDAAAYSVTWNGTELAMASTGAVSYQKTAATAYLYIDGIRIFNPLSADDANISSYLTGEQGAVFTEVKDMMGSQQAEMASIKYDSGTGTLTVSDGNNTFVENRNGGYSGQSGTTLNDYVLVGPNNELYFNGVSNNTALVFYVQESGSGSHELQVALRALDPESLTGSALQNYKPRVYMGVMKNGSYAWVDVTGELVSGTEQYYTLSYKNAPYVEGKGYQIVLTSGVQSGFGGYISFTTVKTTGLSLFTSSYDDTLTVHYGDNGQLVKDTDETEATEAAAYTASAATKAALKAATAAAEEVDETSLPSYRELTLQLTATEVVQLASGGTVYLSGAETNSDDDVEQSGELRFARATLALESDIAMNFYVKDAVLEGYSDPYVVFTKALYDADGSVTGTETETVSVSTARTLTDGTSYQVFTFAGINATEMGSTVTATLYASKDGALYAGTALEYSVLQYATNMLAKDLGDSLDTLLVDMLNYGTAAQEYFGYNTANPVNAGLTDSQKAKATQTAPELSSATQLTKNDGATVHFKSASLSLEEKVTMNFYLDLSGYTGQAEDLRLSIQYTDAAGDTQTAVVDGSAFVQRVVDGKTYYAAAFDGLTAAQMRTVCQVSVVERASGAEVGDSLRYSIESYAAAKQSSEELGSLVEAMMGYGDSVARYFAE